MTELTPILLSALTGFVSGFLLSVPVGPVNLTIINEGARRGFKWAVLIGLGASVDGCDLLHHCLHGIFVLLWQPRL